MPLPSPQPTNKRERDSDSPKSAASNEPSPKEQQDVPRTIAGTRRLNKDARGTAAQQATSQKLPSQPSVALFPRSQQPNPQASSAMEACLTSAFKPSTMTSARSSQTEVFDLPVYSNDLGRLPLHGGVSFSAATHHTSHSQSQSQPHTQAPPQSSSGFWYGAPSNNNGVQDRHASDGNSGPRSSSSASSMSHHVGHSHRPSQSMAPPQSHSQTPEYPHMSEMSHMTPTYGVQPSPVTSGIMLDNVAASLAYTNPHSSFFDGIGSMGDSGALQPSAALHSTFHRVFPSSMDTRVDGDPTYRYQSQPQESQPQLSPMVGGPTSSTMNYGLVDNDTIAMWSNAPTSFECVFCFIMSSINILS